MLWFFIYTWFVVELEFTNIGFWGEGKPGEPGENLFEASTHIDGRTVLSPLINSVTTFTEIIHKSRVIWNILA